MAVASLAAGQAERTAPAAKRELQRGSSFWSRALDRLIEARMRQVRRYLVMRGYSDALAPETARTDLV